MRDNLNDFSGDIALCSRSDPDGNTSRGQVVQRGVLTLINTFGAKDFERQNAQLTIYMSADVNSIAL